MWKKTPFTFKFDETNTSQAKKQYMGTCSFCHCTCDQLLEHFQTFFTRLGLDSHWDVLHIGMDGPNVNSVFEKKLSQYFEDELDSSFLSLGLCSFHPVHTAFRKFATNVSAAYAMKHTETKWRSMKYACVLVLQQFKRIHSKFSTQGQNIQAKNSTNK